MVADQTTGGIPGDQQVLIAVPIRRHSRPEVVGGQGALFGVVGEGRRVHRHQPIKVGWAEVVDGEGGWLGQVVCSGMVRGVQRHDQQPPHRDEPERAGQRPGRVLVAEGPPGARPAGSFDLLGQFASQPAAPVDRIDHQLDAAVAPVELRVADQAVVVVGQPVDDSGAARAHQRQPGGLVQGAGSVDPLGTPDQVEHVIALPVGQVRLLGDHA